MHHKVKKQLEIDENDFLETMMQMNFYQSPLWREITTLYGRKIFWCESKKKKYRGVVKEKKILWFTIRWYQILGIEENINKEELCHFLVMLKKKYCGRNTIMIQFGLTNVLSMVDSEMLKDQTLVKEIRGVRKAFQNTMEKQYHLHPSFKENMPPATVLVDLSKSVEDLREKISKNTKQHIKKARNHGLTFSIAADNERSLFFDIWQKTAAQKGFQTITCDQFEKLKRYIISQNKGNLFLAKQNDRIVSGNICLFVGDTLVYLYGGADRSYGNIGGDQFLKRKLIEWGKKNCYSSFDLLGTAPTGGTNHPLQGVGQLKEGLGGKKIDYGGSFDLIGNPFLYSIWKRVK